ncbi:700_t:CDS:2, partial [Racocetra fulgida]
SEVTESRQVIKRSINGTIYSKDQPWYIIIDNKVYDIKDFAPNHPGGAPILTHIGKDATDLFDSELAREHAKAYPKWFARLMVNNQAINYFPLLAFARLSWCAQSIQYILPNGQSGSIGDTPQAMCGLLLALCFSLNHNGMKVLTDEETMNTEFYVEQVITGRAVTANSLMGRWFVEWFMGGLNYQIEHH